MSEWGTSEEFARLASRREWVGLAPNYFAENLRVRRAALGISQQRVALLMAALYGYTSWYQTTVAKVESGAREVRLSEALALSEIVDVSLMDLVASPSQHQAEVTPDGQHSEEA